MKIKITKQAYDYLKEKNQLNFNSLSVKLINNNYFSLTLDQDQAIEIREWALDKLPEFGFDKDYNLTDEGKLLDEIIDKFFF